MRWMYLNFQLDHQFEYFLYRPPHQLWSMDQQPYFSRNFRPNPRRRY